MSKIESSVQKQNLAQYRTWLIDSGSNSTYFDLSQVPNILTAGKNAFLIAGTPYLVETTQILMEILDVNGNTIFLQPIPNYAEGMARVVSVEVYSDTPPGPATLTILGQVSMNTNGDLPPQEFSNSYNVKYQTQFLVNPFAQNVSPIRLYQQPIISVSEILIPYQSASIGTSQSVNAGLVNGNTMYLPDGQSATAITMVGQKLNRDMIGGPFTASFTSSNGTLTTFRSTISTVLNDSTAYLIPPYTGSDNARKYFLTPSYSIGYVTETQFTPTALTESYALVDIDKLKTFSGDIQRVKVYYQPVNQSTNYQLLTDMQHPVSEITVTQSAFTGQQNIRLGNFTSQSVFNNYWYAGQVVGTTYVAGGVTASYDSSSLMDSIHLTNPSASLTSSLTTPQYWFASTPLNDFMEVSKNGTLEFNLNFNAVCKKLNSSYNSRMDVYLVGTAFPQSIQNPYGTLITSLTVPSGSVYGQFLNESINFLAPISGTAGIYFAIYSGDWYVSNVGVYFADEPGFSPEDIEFVLPYTGPRFSYAQFKAELYDINNNRVNVPDIVSAPAYFTGSNTVIAGSDNQVIGQFTVAANMNQHGITLNATGYTSSIGVPVPNQAAIYIGAGKHASADTPFLVASASTGPIFSLGNSVIYQPSTYGAAPFGQGTFTISANNYFIIQNALSPAGIYQWVTTGSIGQLGSGVGGSGLILDIFGYGSSGGPQYNTFYDRIVAWARADLTTGSCTIINSIQLVGALSASVRTYNVNPVGSTGWLGGFPTIEITISGSMVPGLEWMVRTHGVEF